MNKENNIRLVDLSKFSNFNSISNGNLNSGKQLPKKKWNLNKILLISFLIFSIFFLYNCKYGIFKSNNNSDISPLAYTVK